MVYANVIGISTRRKDNLSVSKGQAHLWRGVRALFVEARAGLDELWADWVAYVRYETERKGFWLKTSLSKNL